MKTLVLGLGEMGASLALDLKKNPDNQIYGLDANSSSLDYALEKGIIDQAGQSLSQVAPEMDLIILATPVQAIINILKELANLPLKDGLIITDLGSTKVEIMKVAKQLFAGKQVAFIGGHPMAGSQKSGVQAGRTSLYAQQTFFLVLANNPVSRASLMKLEGFLQPLDARFIVCQAADHDQWMAAVSDSPHVIAFALMNAAVASLGKPEAFKNYTAGGFKSMTRIAGSDPQLWTDALLSNPAGTLAELNQFKEELDHFYQAIANGDRTALFQIIQQAATARQELMSGEQE
ncbi:prephenate dehydrogenase [Eupransor demetentiae]|uniref:Prephenate dehydrogenase (TyrA) n=1 Tax=Eupransor demetentiae TaxID=3109584 RepID=A0ABM9N3T9_9LACO|nr:Prephenate dehydrogenase (TyrA) [Lactobacillaceae bacterium LMG 33000]